MVGRDRRCIYFKIVYGTLYTVVSIICAHGISLNIFNRTTSVTSLYFVVQDLLVVIIPFPLPAVWVQGSPSSAYCWRCHTNKERAHEYLAILLLFNNSHLFLFVLLK